MRTLRLAGYEWQLSHRWCPELPYRNRALTTKPSLQFCVQRLWVIWAIKLPNSSKSKSGRDNFCLQNPAELRHSGRMTARARLSRSCLEVVPVEEERVSAENSLATGIFTGISAQSAAWRSTGPRNPLIPKANIQSLHSDVPKRTLHRTR